MAILTTRMRGMATAVSALVLAGTLAGCTDREAILSEKIAAADAAARRAEAAATRAEAAAKKAGSSGTYVEPAEPEDPESDAAQDSATSDDTNPDSAGNG